MNLFCVSELNCSIGRILFVVRTGAHWSSRHCRCRWRARRLHHGIGQDDFSHDPPQVTDWGRGAANARVSVDGTGGFCLVEIALDHVGSGDGCTECQDQFLD